MTKEPMLTEFNPLAGNADKIEAGVTLFTKDGRRLGNAIIVKEVEPDYYAKLGGLVEHLELTNQKLWLLETDFGNQMRLSDNEILEAYDLGYKSNYILWWSNRQDLIMTQSFHMSGREGK
jgi:hypothetical protein